jgi:DNA-binding NarL/FixJ family response regulator
MNSGRRRGRPSSTVLTTRQQEILRLIALGLANKQIAVELRIAEPSVKKHVSRLFRRYAVPNRAALVRAAIEARELQTAVQATS